MKSILGQPSSKTDTLFEGDLLSPNTAAETFLNAVAIDKLIRMNVLRPERSGNLRVCFVGVAIVGRKSFQFLPKICDRSPTKASNDMRQVVRALRRYARWKPIFHEPAPYLEVNSANDDVSLIAVSDWLIRDYLANGIYRRSRTRTEINGAGQLSWRRTMDSCSPIISRSKPIYVDVVTRASTGDGDHFISRLHRFAVEESLRCFGYLLGYPQMSLDQELVESFNEIPSKTYCLSRIFQEQRSAFTDRGIRLLPMLLAWLNSEEQATRDNLALFGTSNFENVWEEACVTAFGNEVEKWKTEIPRPKWTLNQHTQMAATFRPDIVVQVDNQNVKTLIIADAKYYRLEMPPTLSGQPGVNDVAKQFWYERYLKPSAAILGIRRIANIFVFPGIDRPEYIWSEGHVQFEGEVPKIQIKRLSGIKALARYADGVGLRPELVSEIANDAIDIDEIS